ncbi:MULTISPECIES: DNA repair protein RecO [unclassified Legionella]|uniref:DNA repair protein RecO n=1 Tax=unclassified Legionella TaxID=2622702 RepID=UPI0010548D27|nr:MULTISPECIES: DNA repair protein RecO [unclassified Legionella]MDI9818549.1 DNA repair protein RecO [Legionella sp. PL877]
MTAEAFEAWVLHKRPSGDSSLYITFFTRERGILHCLCKGGRTPKKQAILQAFTPLWLSVENRKGRHYMQQVENNALPLELKGNRLFAALYINELLYYLLSPLESQIELFDVYLETLHGLAAAMDNLTIEILLRRFEWALLLACGQQVSFTREANSTHLINSNLNYQFVANEGFIPANEGYIAGKEILALAQGCFNEVRTLKVAKFIMRQAIDHLLGGRELKSRALFLIKK